MGIVARLRSMFRRPSKKTIIRSADGKKYLGYVQNGVYYTQRDAKKHYFYKFGGYAISLEVLERLRDAGVGKINIIERRESGDRLLVSALPSWFEKTESYIYKGDCQRVFPYNMFTLLQPGKP